MTLSPVLSSAVRSRFAMTTQQQPLAPVTPFSRFQQTAQPVKFSGMPWDRKALWALLILTGVSAASWQGAGQYADSLDTYQMKPVTRDLDTVYKGHFEQGTVSKGWGWLVGKFQSQDADTLIAQQEKTEHKLQTEGIGWGCDISKLVANTDTDPTQKIPLQKQWDNLCGDLEKQTREYFGITQEIADLEASGIEQGTTLTMPTAGLNDYLGRYTGLSLPTAVQITKGTAGKLEAKQAELAQLNGKAINGMLTIVQDVQGNHGDKNPIEQSRIAYERIVNEVFAPMGDDTLTAVAKDLGKQVFPTAISDYQGYQVQQTKQQSWDTIASWGLKGFIGFGAATLLGLAISIATGRLLGGGSSPVEMASEAYDAIRTRMQQPRKGSLPSSRGVSRSGSGGDDFDFGDGDGD